MAIIYIPAIVEAGDLPGYGVFFPDLPGLTSTDDSVQEAARNAEEALRGHLELMTEDGMAIPEPSALDRIAHDPEVREAARILVRAIVPSERMLRQRDAVGRPRAADRRAHQQPLALSRRGGGKAVGAETGMTQP